MNKTKTCSRCGETKLIGAFRKKDGNQDGRDGRCRPCVKAVQAEYKQRRIEEGTWQGTLRMPADTLNMTLAIAAILPTGTPDPLRWAHQMDTPWELSE